MKNRRKFLKTTSLLVASASVMGYHAGYSKNNSITKGKKEGTTMLQHTVFFWLKDEVSAIDRQRFEKGVKAFVSGIKEVHKAEIGIPADTPDRDVVDHSFAYSLFASFKTMDDHNIYQAHPIHKKFIEDFSDLWARVQVYDSTLV